MAAKKPAPAPTPDGTDVQLNDYVCVEPIKRDGKRMMPGDIISLAEDDPLVISGAVRLGQSGDNAAAETPAA